MCIKIPAWSPTHHSTVGQIGISKALEVLQMNRNSNKLKKCNKPPSLAFDCEFEFELASIAAKLHEETK